MMNTIVRVWTNEELVIEDARIFENEDDCVTECERLAEEEKFWSEKSNVIVAYEYAEDENYDFTLCIAHHDNYSYEEISKITGFDVKDIAII